MSNHPLKYTPLQSFVELLFFTKLAERKLNEYKLDDSTRPILGFMTKPQQLTKFNDRPILNLDYSSFEEGSPENVQVDGVLHNVNTIEEFKLLDKLALLKKWGNELRDSVLLGHVPETFHLLTYSDLKKYRFYYWLAYPVLHLPWTVVNTQNNNEYELQIEEYLRDHEEAFFQVQDEEIAGLDKLLQTEDGTFVFVDSCLSPDGSPLVQLKNYLYLLAVKGFKDVLLLVYRNNGLSYTARLHLEDTFDKDETPKVTGWERTVQGKLGPKLADIGLLINPHQLAEQAVDLNLKLMKWRVAVQLDLEAVSEQKVLLLGAGTLGSYVARALMAWGVRHITFVDSGQVLYLNPVRQPLFAFKDCFSENGQGAYKATRASEALREIFPGVHSQGHVFEVPMIGHPGGETKSNYAKLEQLYKEHDAVFLLMDSREARWLPTVMGVALYKTVINAALGFDSYLVMRHTPLNMTDRLGCYYCNDVVAPADLLSDRTLDQMCTVTRPGGALMASALAVELYVALLQHPEKQRAPVGSGNLGEVPHQIRGFLHNFQQSKFSTPAYKHCLGCSDTVLTRLREEGWLFVEKCLESTDYLEEICGLKADQAVAEAAAAELDNLSLSDDEEFD